MSVLQPQEAVQILREEMGAQPMSARCGERGGDGKVELIEEMTSSLDLEGHVGIS